MKVRIKFEKLGPIRYIGHLDFMRTLQKVIRRASIPIAYSEGFSPHQIFSIAAPLAVGVESLGEYLDMKLEEPVDLAFLVKQLNPYMPPGVKVLHAWELADEDTPGMAAVAAAKYNVFQKSMCIKEEHVHDLLKHETLMIRKQNKKGKYNDFDLKPGIIDLSYHNGTIIMSLATGSVLNIKPEMILKKIEEINEIVSPIHNYRLQRIDLYQQLEKKLDEISEITLGDQLMLQK